MLFVTDGRYQEQSREQLDAAGVDARIEIAPTGAAQREILGPSVDGARRVSASRPTASRGRSSGRTRSGSPPPSSCPTDGLVEGLRRVKEPGEVARIRAACAIADDALGGAAAVARGGAHGA